MHGADLGAHVIKALVERNDIPPAEYDDVIFGCVDTIGALAGDIARTAWLAAGMPLNVPGTTVDRQCGSSQQAVHFAAQAVMSGTQDVVLAGGVQTMSSIPISSAMLAGQPLGFTTPFAESIGWKARFGDAPVNQFYAAQRIADHWGLSREAMEIFAKESHDRALRAMHEGRFDREVVPYPLPGRVPHGRDGAREHLGQDGHAGTRGRQLSEDHRRGFQLHLRRCRRGAGGVGDGTQALRPEAARAHPPPERSRRRSDLAPHGADCGHRARAEEGGHEAERHRPRRDQRGLCVGGDGLAEGNRLPARAHQRQRGAIALGHPLGPAAPS